MRDHQPFEQRIAGQAIRAVQAGAADFADRVQSRQSRRAIDVRLHSAALIMRRRHDRDRLLRDVDAELQASLVNVRESVRA